MYIADCPLDSTKNKGTDSCSRICDLVTDSLLPYIEPRCCQLTKETEKDLLLSLSMISKKIKQLASEDGCRFEQDFVENFVSAHSCSKNLDQHFVGEYCCLANMVTTMVSFLNIDNQFVQHVAGNILSSLSCLLTSYVNKWLEFIHMLLIIVESSISSICSAMSSTMESIVLIDGSSLHCYPLTIGETFQTENPCFDFTGFIALLQARLGKVSWPVVAALTRILRNILKSLKLENGDLEGAFTGLVVSSLVKIPWDVFCGIHASESLMIHVGLGKVDLQDRHNGLKRTTGVLLGTVLQLLCSLVKQDYSEDERDGPLGELATYSKFTNLVPQLLSSCFSKCMRHKDMGLSTYLRHKMLVSINSIPSHHVFEVLL
ncbi:uncharacterized protein A4U43_C03F22840 [Asparagus officinalis]|uniref:Uncharacterized protein n=1 Tax=Asparagus officinalis TaxID=4686 RepID=A0A5P1FC95_ASPOF|nr:uncharacterized protein A4U43_C03F22840 [Asparagus officinalis]